MLFARIFRPFL
jgi:hypothetical protein